MAAPRTAVGIDLGGTKIAAALVGADGSITSRSSLPTPAAAGPEAVLDAVAALAAPLLARAPASGAPALGVGIGAAGVIDPGTATVLSATDHLPGWAGTDLRAGLGARLGLHPQQVQAVNDVHAHALGEGWLGAGTGTDSVLLAAFGTGIGGSLLLHGVPVFGARQVGGHLGHVPAAEAAGLRCPCGGTGHLEAIASGPALHALYLRRGGDLTVPDARAVFARAAAGDLLAAGAIDTAATAAGRALGGLANTLDPESVILSGGLADAGERWWAPLRAAFAAELIAPLASLVPQPAALGADAALAGAASLLLLRAHATTVPA
ncbi:ROK family protein [Paeniglutamicibacter sp. ABSL32-1]|uniref:ROK family protein n=1 Tax=Paeniglutamicibacter quisquiliarum TaxID=2849498 RepID=UPI001C2DC05E|nr:ROK family protein [Paeniglutamicibacter quisquiliarum]MBV1779966.1 ROK family protein [Paeniglutamicibacter quisquiliarum]